jgi:cell division protein FtsL
MKLKGAFRYGFFINLGLVAVILASALLLVRWQYTSRNLFVALEKTENTGKQLTSVHASRLAEKRQLSSAARVERLASQNLSMTTADPAVTVYLKP